MGSALAQLSHSGRGSVMGSSPRSRTAACSSSSSRVARPAGRLEQLSSAPDRLGAEALRAEFRGAVLADPAVPPRLGVAGDAAEPSGLVDQGERTHARTAAGRGPLFAPYARRCHRSNAECEALMRNAQRPNALMAEDRTLDLRSGLQPATSTVAISAAPRGRVRDRRWSVTSSRSARHLRETAGPSRSRVPAERRGPRLQRPDRDIAVTADAVRHSRRTRPCSPRQPTVYARVLLWRGTLSRWVTAAGGASR